MYLSPMQKKGEVNMGWMDDIKKGFKGSKKYQDAKAKKKVKKASKKRDDAKKDGKVGKQKRAQNKINKALGSKVKHTKDSIKKSNKEDASFSKAKKSAKASGTSISSLVKQRKGLTKGTDAYARVQNQINKHYGSAVKHKVSPKSGMGREGRKSIGETLKKNETIVIDKVAANKKRQIAKAALIAKKEKIAKDKAKVVTKKKQMASGSAQGGTGGSSPAMDKDKYEMADGGMVNDMKPQYKHGGKVKGGGLFDFPSSNSRK